MHAAQVADAIMANGALTHYDRPRIAQLCEKAGLYMRALQHYSDLPDIKRVIVNTHAIDPQQLLEFFGSLSAEWALECLRVRPPHGWRHENTCMHLTLCHGNFAKVSHHQQVPTCGCLALVSALANACGCLASLFSRGCSAGGQAYPVATALIACGRAQELLGTNIAANLQLVVQVAKEYTEQLGAGKIIEMLEAHKSYHGLYYYLGSHIAFSEDPEARHLPACLSASNLKPCR